MKFLTPKAIGIDLYDLPLKAVNSDGEALEETKLSTILQSITTVANYNLSTEEIINNHKYWGDFELTAALIKYATEKLRSKFFKSKILLSVPHEVVRGNFSEIYKRMISEAAIQAGGREVQIVENIFCAAAGAGLPIKEYSKTWVLYANHWCTYIYMIFAGVVIISGIIERSIKEISKKEIFDMLNSLKDDIPTSFPKIYHETDTNSTDISNIEAKWLDAPVNKIYMIVPDTIKSVLGQSLDNYQLIYSDNYESCIIKGLESIVKELRYELNLNKKTH